MARHCLFGFLTAVRWLDFIGARFGRPTSTPDWIHPTTPSRCTRLSSTVVLCLVAVSSFACDEHDQLKYTADMGSSPDLVDDAGAMARPDAGMNPCAEDNGGCEQNCTHDEGARCSCDEGWTLNADGHTCDDIDECAKTEGDDLRTFARQLDTRYDFVAPSDYNTDWGGRGERWIPDRMGNWFFILATGELFTWTTDTLPPEGDLVATLSSAYHTKPARLHDAACDHSCVNDPGTYHCTCEAGWLLGDDGRTCIELDACNEGNGGCAQTCADGLTATVHTAQITVVARAIRRPRPRKGTVHWQKRGRRSSVSSLCIGFDSKYLGPCRLGFARTIPLVSSLPFSQGRRRERPAAIVRPPPRPEAADGVKKTPPGGPPSRTLPLLWQTVHCVRICLL